MRAPIITMPGKMGDLVFSVATMAAIAELYKSKIYLITTQFCAAATRLLSEKVDFIEGIRVYEGYRPTAMEPGLQPIGLPIPKDLLEDGHRDIFEIGFRRHPVPHEDIAMCCGAPYQFVPKPGPWLPRVNVNKSGPVLMHAPVDDPWSKAALRELLDRKKGHEIRLIGTPMEFSSYQRLKFDQVEGVTLRQVNDLLDVWELANGCSSFCGIASAPAVVAVGAGLSATWVIRPGGRETCVPKGCDIKIIRTTINS